jgi:hypothetical protein
VARALVRAASRLFSTLAPGSKLQQPRRHVAFSSQRLNDGSLQAKMIGPPIFPRIEKRNQTSRARGQRPNIGTLPQIATEATISEVIPGRRAAVLPAHNMIYLVRRIRVILIQQTVFATELRALGYQSS